MKPLPEHGLTVDPDEDERDEDYEVFRDENGELIDHGDKRWLEYNERSYQERMGKEKSKPISAKNPPQYDDDGYLIE